MESILAHFGLSMDQVDFGHVHHTRYQGGDGRETIVCSQLLSPYPQEKKIPWEGINQAYVLLRVMLLLL